MTMQHVWSTVVAVLAVVVALVLDSFLGISTWLAAAAPKA